MNYALIFAGGTGQRMSTKATPKQFLQLRGKEIIIYTVEHFDHHGDIDGIIIVCLESYIEYLKVLLNRYSITKVIQILPGGESVTKSVYSGLNALSRICNDEDIVLIHDGVRPLINADLISMNILKAREFGNVITVQGATESIVQLNKNEKIVSIPPRSEMYIAKAPQTFKFATIWNIYQKANADGFDGIDSAHLCNKYGCELYTVKCMPNNIKITAPCDYYVFRALLEAEENSQFLGFGL
jgi:2-C-methyl-D-erythritol 4-phosphate cytidylyltransferase